MATVHRCLLARGEGRPGASAGAGPSGGCRRAGGVGKSDASRALGSAPGRPAGDRGDRGAPRDSAGGAGPRRGDSGPGPPGGTAGCSRPARDHTRGRGRTAAGRGGRPAPGGSPRPRGPGEVKAGSGQRRGNVRQLCQAAHAPAGWVRPRARRFPLWALIPRPPGSRQPTRKLPYLPLCGRPSVRIYPLSGER